MASYQLWSEGGKPAYPHGFAIPEYFFRGTDTELGAQLDNVVRLGATWLRTDAYWNAAEQTQGTYSWTNLDRITSFCQSRGIHVVFVAHTMPPWARPQPTDPDVTGPTTDTQRTGYVNFVTALASRYYAAGVVRAIEIWNEPNLDQFWSPTPSATDYRTLLQASYQAIKNVAPNMIVLGCCTGGAAGAPDIPTQTFVTDVCANGGVNYMDAVSHHPYALPGGVSGSLTETSTVQNAVKNAGRALDVWGTEWGCSTGGTDTPVVSEATHAATFADGMRYWRNIKAGGVLFWYTLNEPVQTDTTTSRYAPIKYDGTDKPIAVPMQAFGKAVTAAGLVDASKRVVA